jgi:hypothetical protein
MPLVNPPNGVIGCQLTAYGFPLLYTQDLPQSSQREKNSLRAQRTKNFVVLTKT